MVSKILPLLLQAGCLADNRAMHVSSVLYSTGLGVEKQFNKVRSTGSAIVKLFLWGTCLSFYTLSLLCVAQAWLLALLAAQKDDRMALLHLGYLHHQGLLGLPTDPDLAYAYYVNIAKQTTVDRHNPTPEQVMYALETGCFGVQILHCLINVKVIQFYCKLYQELIIEVGLCVFL